MYKIYYIQTEKITGKTIGKGMSAKSYIRKGNAERVKHCFEFENDLFVQKASVREV